METGCDGLLKAGILVGDKQEILDKSVMAAFFPHGSKYYYYCCYYF